MDELTSVDVLVLIQAVESLVEQSAELVTLDSPLAGSPALSLSTVVQAPAP